MLGLSPAELCDHVTSLAKATHSLSHAEIRAVGRLCEVSKEILELGTQESSFLLLFAHGGGSGGVGRHLRYAVVCLS